MVSVSKGKRLHGKDFRSGTSARGPWEMVHVTDEKGQNEVTIWFNNVPSGMTASGGDFVVKEILEVKNGKRKSKTTDKWFPSVDFEIIAEVCQPDTTFDDAVAAGDVTFEDVGGGFSVATAGTDPWAEVTTQERMPWDETELDPGELPF